MRLLARRYAGALLKAAYNNNIVEEIENDLRLIRETLQTIPKLRQVLLHPLIPTELKKRLISEVLGKQLNKISASFVELIIEKRREKILEEIEPEYSRLARETRGIKTATVISAVPLTGEEVEILRSRLEKLTGKQIEIATEQDASLIGGLVVRIGDTVLDGSVKGHLQRLRNQLLGHA